MGEKIDPPDCPSHGAQKGWLFVRLKSIQLQRSWEGDHVSREADALKQKATDDIARIKCRSAAERFVREAFEQRGLIARLMNRKPTMVEG